MHMRPAPICRMMEHVQDEDLAKQWAADINEAVSAISCRPKTLLVIVNPWGGNGRADRAWTRHAYPIFSQAGNMYRMLYVCRFVYSVHPCIFRHDTVLGTSLLG